ncbi:MAG: sugar phosphate isomerase/epimerase family protein [Lautropia sp.]
MRIGVSNLLWTPDRDDAVAQLLRRLEVDAIDLAPTRYFADPAAASAADWRRIAARWHDRGIAITGLQSLLHGADGLALFGPPDSRARLTARLAAMLDVAVAVGAGQLVFGSWQNRRRGALPLAAAIDAAAELFTPLAVAAAARGVCLSIEPIFSGYGNDFLVDHDEALRLVERIDHPGFGLTLDVGCLGLAGEDVAAVLARCASRITHVQLAEHRLAPLSANNRLHARAGPAISRALPGRVACIEALTPAGHSAVDAVAQSLAVARAHYR